MSATPRTDAARGTKPRRRVVPFEAMANLERQASRMAELLREFSIYFIDEKEARSEFGKATIEREIRRRNALTEWDGLDVCACADPSRPCVKSVCVTCKKPLRVVTIP